MFFRPFQFYAKFVMIIFVISEEEVKKLSMLARVGLAEKEIAEFQKDLDGILDFVSVLKEAKIPENIKEEARANVFREDEAPHKSAEYSEVLLKEAPSREGTLIKVNKIFGDD